jgi:hypothetical protein
LANSNHKALHVDSERRNDRTPPRHPSGNLNAQLRQLYRDLFLVIERDPEQEIIGIALPVVDALIAEARLEVRSAHGGLAGSIVELISPTTCNDGQPVRALDTWLVVGQLVAALDLDVELESEVG